MSVSIYLNHLLNQDSSKISEQLKFFKYKSILIFLFHL